MRGSALLVLLLIASACRSTDVGPPPPRIRVDPGAADAPQRISAAALPVTEAEFHDALDRAGLGLRVAGRRDQLVLRYAALDPAAENLLTETFGVSSRSFSEPTGFGAGDVIEIETLAGDPPAGFTLHAVPQNGPDGPVELSVGVVVRPPDGALLPVIRGLVPIAGSGSLLLTGECPERRPFVAILRLTLAGSDRISNVVAPRRHDVVLRTFSFASDDLAEALGRLSLPEFGGIAGVAVHVVPAADVEETERVLSDAGRAEKPRVLSASGSESVQFPLGDLTIRVHPHFRLADWSYSTGILVSDHPGAEPEVREHGERDHLLVIGWNAAGIGESRAALFRILPRE